MNWAKKRKNAGFTLVELLVTIFIIGIVIGIGTYFVINTINNSKEKTKEIAYENIKTSARLYIEENYEKVLWKQNDETTETTCVLIETLVNKGYLKKSDIENISYTSIIVTKNTNNKSIISEKLDTENKCGNDNIATVPTSNKYCLDVTYNGETQTLTKLAGEGYTFTENEGNDARKYSVTATLKEGYSWSDNSNDKTKIITCSIKKANIELLLEPDGTSPTIGTEKTTLKTNIPGTISIKSSNDKYATASVTDTNIETEKDITINILATRNTATTITITVTPNDEYKKNYKETSIDYTIENITRNKVAIPTDKYCKNLTYTGDTQTLTEAPDEGYIFIDNEAKDLGPHTVTAKLKYGYEWEDGSLTPKTFDCIIREEISKIYTIKLNYHSNALGPNGVITNTGTTKIYENYNNGIFMNYTLETTMTTTQNPIEIPEATGYTFLGYHDDTRTQLINKDGYLTDKFTSTKFASDATLDADWTANDYTITLDKQGGTGGSDFVYLYYDNNVYLDSDLTQIMTTKENYITIPEKKGYIFMGYYKEPQNKDPENTSEMLIDANGYITNKFSNSEYSDNATIFAHWKAITYQIKYISNIENTSNSMTNTICTYDEECTIAKNQYSNSGYTFDSWSSLSNEEIASLIKYGYTEEELEKYKYNENDIVINLASTNNFIIELYAQWTPNTYTINLDTQGGSMLVDEEDGYYPRIFERYNDRIYQISYENEMTSSKNNLPTPIKVGYNFSGYYLTQTPNTTETLFNKMINENGYKDKLTPTTFTSNGTLYANWEPKTFTITLDKQGGTDGTDEIYELYNTNIYRLANTSTRVLLSNGENKIILPTKDGYAFQGYYTTAGTYSNGKKKGTKLIDENGYLTSKFTTTKIKQDSTLYAYWIDNTAPTCGNISYTEGTSTTATNGQPTTWTKKNRTITVACNDVNCASTSVSEAYTTTKESDSLTISDGTYTTACEFNVLIDTTIPTINYSVTDSDKWINYDRQIIINLTDEHSGLAGYAISTSNTTAPTTWKSISNKPNTTNIFEYISTNGTYYIWAKDAVGNTSVSGAFETKIDKDKPIIVAKTYKSGTSTLLKSATSSNTNEIKINTWVNYAYDFNFTGTKDSLSGIKSYVWQWNTPGSSTLSKNLPTNNKTSNTSNNIEYEKTLSADGARYARLTVTDNAGNSTYMDIIVYIDTIAPIINTSITSPKTNIQISWTANSDGSTYYLTKYDDKCDTKTKVCNLVATYPYKAGTTQIHYLIADGHLYKDDLSGFSYMDLEWVGSIDKNGNNHSSGAVCDKYTDAPCITTWNTIVYDKAGNSSYGYQIKHTLQY